MFMKNFDEIFMKRALTLAELGRGKTFTNPLVGCVIVKNNLIIGQGWHKKFGSNHAEINAIENAKQNNFNLEGSTLYVNLEPCSHYGKTPPCALRLVSEKISRVVIAMSDPNNLVNGKGIKILKDAGINVDVGILENEAKYLNRGFIFYHKYKRPYVLLKIASSLDGKIALSNGYSKWITGTQSRIYAHELRAEYDGILTGINTILNDDPELTVRNISGKDPTRIILDANLKIPENSKVLPCVILTGEDSDKNKISRLETSGSTVKKLPAQSGNINLNSALEYLHSIGILKLMVEGGASVIGSFLRENLADEIKIFTAPKILGEGLNFVSGFKINNMDQALNLKNIKSRNIGEDILIEGVFKCSPAL